MSEPLVEFLVANVARWIAAQRDRHRPTARSIPPGISRSLTPFFAPQTLAVARVARVPVVENPGFFDELGEVPMDLRDSAGITFGDTILISDLHSADPPPVSLVFHELVHVVQYEILGVPEFARRYVTGWDQSGREYLRIPLELQAFALERRFLEGTLGDDPVESLVLAELER